LLSRWGGGKPLFLEEETLLDFRESVLKRRSFICGGSPFKKKASLVTVGWLLLGEVEVLNHERVTRRGGSLNKKRKSYLLQDGGEEVVSVSKRKKRKILARRFGEKHS